MLNILTSETKLNKNEEIRISKSFSAMLLDSFIIAVIAAFSLWTGEKVDLEHFLPLVKCFILSFVIQLGYYRGIKR